MPAARIDLDLIRQENFIHMRGDPLSPEGRIIRARMRRRFYYEYPEWKRAVLACGMEVFPQSRAAVESWR